jgi:hypothetical protein
MALVEDAGTADVATTRSLASRYLAFVSHAFNPEIRRFRNFMAYRRTWLDECGSEDSHGRALWALGAVVGHSTDPGRQSLAGHLFHLALPAVSTFESARGRAFALLGINEYLRAFQGDSAVEALRERLSERLFTMLEQNRLRDWNWYEDKVTYDNARLPQALLVSGHRMGNDAMTAAALSTLEWLLAIQRSDEGDFAPIGSNGFYGRGAGKALFDQQPLEACAMVSACIDAFRVTRDERWARDTRFVFRWFLGENHLHTPLYDPATGGCRDGLHADRPNQNQGAESTLSFLLALTEMGMLESEVTTHPWNSMARAGSQTQLES